MISRLAKAILYLLSLTLGAQNWAPLGKGFDMGFYPRTMVVDSVNNKLIVGGDFKWINSDSVLANGIATWDGAKWDSLGQRIQECPSCNNVAPVTKLYWFKNDLYADGFFSDPGSAIHHGKFNPVTKSWENLNLCSDPTGTWQSWSNTVNDDSLVISGLIDTVCNLPKAIGFFYDGTNFYSYPPLAQLPANASTNFVRYLFKYKGIWYVSGLFYNPSTGTDFGFAMYDGANWVPVPGFTNCPGFSLIKKFNDELYFAGPFYKQYGSPGNAIVKFDGTTWSDLSGGALSISHNPNDHNSGFTDFTMHNGELYAVGYFYDTTNYPYARVVKYNGHEWCTTGDVFDNEIDGIGFLNDTMYVAGAFNHINTQVIRGAAKYIGGAFTQCDAAGVNETGASAHLLSIYPNPANTYISISSKGADLKGATVYIENTLGQMALSVPYSETIDVATLPAGYYILTIKTSENRVFKTKFMKE
ncbi:MAG: T9SS type A sorting domain-containing protein [Bacteroidetes bacterium]|nr:T9SS type A sorting domain-containing protein [Bacteroidota bacterium]